MGENYRKLFGFFVYKLCSRGDDVQRSIELLDKVLSEYDEHGTDNCTVGEIEVVGEEGSSASGVGDAVDEGDADADVDGEARRGSSTEPSIGLTPDDESPSLGLHIYFFFLLLLYFHFYFFSSSR